jgi:hypothetical protein
MELMELHLNEAKPRIVLLEPYRKAVVTQAITEGLGRVVESHTNKLRSPATSDDIAKTMQLLVLYEHVNIMDTTMSHEEEHLESDPMARLLGLRYVNLEGLKRSGIVDFTVVQSHEASPQLTEIPGWWLDHDHFLIEYESFLLGQLSMVGFDIHWSLLRLLSAIRTGNELRMRLLESSVPGSETEMAKVFMRYAWEREFIFGVDAQIIAAVVCLETSFGLALNSNSYVAGTEPTLHTDRGSSAHILWRILVDRLVPEGIDFPVPQSFSDVTRLRNLPEIRAFRDFFFPFLDAAISGDMDSFRRFQGELSSVIRRLKRLPIMKKAILWSTYASIASGVVEALTQSLGPSIPLALLPLGLERLAKRWEKRGSWLYLSSDSRDTSSL